ncbi:apolipoprotein A1/A4/E family protein [Chitinophaga vietnamensis]|uniref:apolipoprotein A1/A4/E family protein n=1 Tax=Chitinophaga vietnamensis TaxID=2593957 RepID=UPI001F24DE2E|nr:apolipoprotein A1/A4/E family protein [Chitinophaga vietnamensis]
MTLILQLSVTYAQDSTVHKALKVPDKYFSEVNRKASRLESQVTKRSQQALSRMMKEEDRMRRRLMGMDSSAARRLFSRSADSLANLKQRLRGKLGKVPGANMLAGNMYLDSLQNSLAFLKDSKGLLNQSKGLSDKLNGSMQSIDQLKEKLQAAEEIKAYIRERKKLLQEQLSQYTGFTKDLQKMNKEAYYYAQQLKEYKEIFKDKKKAERKVMEAITKVPAFNDFMQKHSYLASLFNIQGGGGGATPNLEGLQTRSQVERLIQQRIGNGPNASAAVSQQMAEARSKFDELKSKFPDLDNAGEMPNFKPNEMKTKSFLQRLEFGSNIQFQRSTKFFPSTSDLAGQVAYRFHKNGSLGIGASYKLGMGTGFDHIQFTSQGLGIRSFIDWKLKGTFFMNGGYEQNYQPEYTSIPNGAGQQWTSSALLGISKKYKINSKLKGSVMLLFDFLYNQHVPMTDPVKLRMGYNF